ncbi:MAG TPA: LLM class flavin-dependent oxidoreductase [Solirubrobacteraceae bacterium]|jgi:alkanesulfonate monooxygenase SsuD/methylene tetrahydromethanopterin reductase-like flavin-dependent oxidoreductase (luciferase family)
MRLGLLCTANVDTSQAVRDYVEFNVEAEALGFASTFLVEHHFSGFNQVAATLMLQTLVASRTSTLRLGTGVMVLPWHNPVLLAEQAATLDVISDGRLDFGVGKGYRYSEFRGFGIDQNQADARFEESLEVLRRAWTSRDRFSHRGRFWSFEDIVVEPAPAQSPYPPIWVAAASEASIRRAAARGYNLILDQYASVEQIRERIGWFGDGNVAVARQTYVAHSRAEAEDALARLAAFTRRIVEVSRSPGSQRGSHVLGYAETQKHALYGTPDQVCAGLQALSETGVSYVLLQLATDPQQLRRIAHEVIAPHGASH